MLFVICSAPLLFSFSSQTATWKTITAEEYEKMMEKTVGYLTGKTPFKVDIRISSYKTHATTTAFETQDGYYIRSGKNYHTFLMGLHSYQNKKYRFVVDTSDKTIMIAEPENEKNQKPLFDTYQEVKKYVSSYKVLTLENTTKVRIDFTNKMKIARVEMEIDKEGIPLKTSTYMRVELSENSGDPGSEKSSPRLETIFSNYKKNYKVDIEKEFSDSRFFVITNGKFSGVGNYKNYTIHDTRLNTN
jgi:hypothetical protein